MKKDLDFSAIFTMSDAMKLAGYEGLPGGRELIAKVEEQETVATHRMRPAKYTESCDFCRHQEGRHYCLLHSTVLKNMDTIKCDEWQAHPERTNEYIPKIIARKEKCWTCWKTPCECKSETAASTESMSEESPESAIERTTAPPASFSSPGESQ